jgi:hypothetical protein
MSRKMMTKEVTHTLVKSANMIVDENGQPVPELVEDQVFIGNVSVGHAQRLINKKFPETKPKVFSVEPKTEVYEMPVEEFIKLASIKVETPEAIDSPVAPE